MFAETVNDYVPNYFADLIYGVDAVNEEVVQNISLDVQQNIESACKISVDSLRDAYLYLEPEVKEEE